MIHNKKSLKFNWCKTTIRLIFLTVCDCVGLDNDCLYLLYSGSAGVAWKLGTEIITYLVIRAGATPHPFSPSLSPSTLTQHSTSSKAVSGEPDLTCQDSQGRYVLLRIKSRAEAMLLWQNNPSSTLPHYTPHKQVTKADIFKKEKNFTPSVDRMGWECQQIYNICIMYTYCHFKSLSLSTNVIRHIHVSCLLFIFQCVNI